MKKLFTTFLILLLIGSAYAQTYSYEIKMSNFEQINETEFQYDK